MQYIDNLYLSRQTGYWKSRGISCGLQSGHPVDIVFVCIVCLLPHIMKTVHSGILRTVLLGCFTNIGCFRWSYVLFAADVALWDGGLVGMSNELYIMMHFQTEFEYINVQACACDSCCIIT